jgi:hypothetical protein
MVVRTTNTPLPKTTNLVELKGVEKLVQLPILLSFLELDEVLLETMKGELGLVIDEDLERLKEDRKDA